VNSWGHFEALASQRAYLHFVEARNTEALNKKPWFPLRYILGPCKGIHSLIMGDVVLRGKLPHPKLMEFSSLI
jgi:hypothetical protein